MLNLDKNQRYLLACSFGPDSMALFHMLLNEGYYFEVAHVNYHLRKESIEEQENLRAFCQKNHVVFHLKDVEEKLSKTNIEKICRDLRYLFFKKVIENNNLDAVLTGHHQDDVIETYVMQKRRRNLVLYYGIKEKTTINEVTIVRPLLNFSKKYLLDYCKNNHIPFAIDKSNLTDRYLRNVIRHKVVEKLTNEEREKHLLEIKKSNEQLQAILDKITQIDNCLNESYLRLNNVELLYALVLKGRQLKTDFKMSKKQGLEIRKILSSKTPNISVIIDGISFNKNYDSFSFSKLENPSDFSYILEKPSKLETPYFYLDFTRESENRNVSEKDYPLTIRNARPSDKYLIKDYFKTMRRLFIDWKMPTYLRKRWPIILNREDRVIYVPRYRRDFILEDNCNFYVKKNNY
ncbi:MAG TPA: tRNA lysidine(34) synthetase TilS [Erysipelotrichaceae bacterium]|nr:tRNA lysidine(34) synthetase TilS [Erysipelotrichaceae bacterium]